MSQPNDKQALEMPYLVFEIEDAITCRFVANMPMRVIVIDHDLKRVGGTVGEVVQQLQPDDIRSQEEIGRYVTDTINDLIDAGH